MFSTSIIEKLAYYVYCLIDPRDGNIFYVGKGVGNRVFHHALGSLQETETPSDKIALIRIKADTSLCITFCGTTSKQTNRLLNMKRWQ